MFDWIMEFPISKCLLDNSFIFYYLNVCKYYFLTLKIAISFLPIFFMDLVMRNFEIIGQSKFAYRYGTLIDGLKIKKHSVINQF